MPDHPTSAWAPALAQVKEHVVLIETPSGHGTGFLMSGGCPEGCVAIATALHVVDRSIQWQELMRVTHAASGRQVLLEHNKLVTCYKNPPMDLALAVYVNQDLPRPEGQLRMLAAEIRLLEGVQIGWCGFPSIVPRTLCFFTGHISACIQGELLEELLYVVDGVAIHGVSGGPAFQLDENADPLLIGLVSAYCPNRQAGETLPGVAFVRASNPYARLLELLREKKEPPSVI